MSYMSELDRRMRETHPCQGCTGDGIILTGWHTINHLRYEQVPVYATCPACQGTGIGADPDTEDELAYLLPASERASANPPGR